MRVTENKECKKISERELQVTREFATVGKTTLILLLLETRQLDGMSTKTPKKTQNQQNIYKRIENTNSDGKFF